MDTPAALCFRNALNPVNSAFIFQSGISSLTCYHEYALFESSDSVFVQRDHLCLPSSAVRIMNIHTVDLSRKKRRFITACACPDLNDNVLIIIRIFREQKDLQLLFQFFYTFSRIAQLFFRKFSHLFVRLFLKHRQTVFDVLPALLVLIVSLYDRRKITLLFHQFSKPYRIVRHTRLL